MPNERKPAIDDLVIGQCAMCGGPVPEHGAVRDTRHNLFCSAACADKFAAFADRVVHAQTSPPPPLRLRYRLKTLFRRLVIAIIFLVVFGAATTYFDVPVFAPFFRRILETVGM